MFYENQPFEQRNEYKYMLTLMGSLSKLFSDSDQPLLYYRVHENIFCKYFDATNLSREDCSADATKGTIGIGLKTWIGNDNQKIAEFGKLRPEYKDLSGIELIKKISEFRNERIRVTKKMHGLNDMIYHIVKRIPHGMRIYESAFDCVDIDNIVLDENRGNENNIYFSDGKHEYHFSMSKNTLYMIFNDMQLLDEFDVEILEDPYEALKLIDEHKNQINMQENHNKEMLPQLCLRLYAVKSDGTKYVPERSGLNQWNANGRKRDANELYIAYLAQDRERDLNFFPPRDTPFILVLPDGSEIDAKVCQCAYKKKSIQDYNKLSDEEKVKENAREKAGKAIMSNPNSILGKWLLRDVFELPEGTLVTYDMLKIFNVDSVLFTRISQKKYKINFCVLGTYEKMYNLQDPDAESNENIE